MPSYPGLMRQRQNYKIRYITSPFRNEQQFLERNLAANCNRLHLNLLMSNR